MAFEKRRMERRKVTYYLPVTEPGSSRLVGVVVDITPRGFKLDTGEKTPVGQVRRFVINLSDEVAPPSARIFLGCSRWCRADFMDSSSYKVGYEFINVTQDNAKFFTRLYEDYGAKTGQSREYDSSDYIWK